MAQYMITYNLPGENRNEAIKRFAEGSAIQPPEGVTSVGRWHAVDGNIGWSLVETDDPKTIMDWLLHWSDIITYEVVPVIGDDELGALFQKHDLG